MMGKTTNVSTNTKATQAAAIKGLSPKDVITKVGPLFTADMRKSGVLASVSLAQFILESGYGQSVLTQKANNCFGMKKSLSGNNWGGSTWDGKSVYTKRTAEYRKDGSAYFITAAFRKYASVEDSIADHTAYLLGAMDGSKLRYNGLKGCTDFHKATQIIQNGGYATSNTYAKTLCALIERWGLTQYDRVGETETSSFLVRVSISNLNIRKGPGTDYSKTGKHTGRGTFTIVETQNGKGSASGWGRLKSGSGWIALDYCERV